MVNGPEPGALNIFNAVAYYVVAPASVALLLPYFYHRAFDNRLVTRAAYFISSRTYALYLCHLPVCLFVTLLVPSFPAVTLAPLLAVNFVVADLLYRFVEKPILRRRPHGVVARTRAAQAVAQTAGSA